jgi:hypothetical protein
MADAACVADAAAKHAAKNPVSRSAAHSLHAAVGNDTAIICIT